MDTGDLIAEFAALDDALAKMRPHIARHKVLREQLVAIAEQQPAAEPGKMLTIDHPTDTSLSVYFTPREEQRRITSLEKVRKRLGAALFLRLASFTLKALDAHVPASEQAALKLTVSERTGPRTVTVVRKLPSVVEKAS